MLQAVQARIMPGFVLKQLGMAAHFDDPAMILLITTKN